MVHLHEYYLQVKNTLQRRNTGTGKKLTAVAGKKHLQRRKVIGTSSIVTFIAALQNIHVSFHAICFGLFRFIRWFRLRSTTGWLRSTSGVHLASA